MARDLTGKTVVLTGASSGIGRATAFAFARAGCRLTLAARRGQVLEEVTAECRALGAEAMAVVTDVTDAAAVQRLAERAVAEFGGIDVWINNAGSGVFGRFMDAKIELHQQTLAVSLLGTLNGSYAALGVFERTDCGILINMASAGAWTPLPLGVAYTTAKFGVRGLSAALRSEYVHRRDIHICAVFPFLIDTPGLHHAANVSGRAINPGPYLYSAEHVAKAFLAIVRRPRDEVAVGWMARAGQASFAIARAPTEAFMGATMLAAIARADPGARSEGSLPVPAGATDRTDGGWRRRKKIPAAETIERVIVIASVVGAVGVLARRRRAAD